MSPAGQGKAIEDTAGIPGRQRSAAGIEKQRVGSALLGDKRGARRLVRNKGVKYGLANGDPSNFCSFAQYCYRPSSSSNVTGPEPASFADSEAGAVEQLDEELVSARDRYCARIALICVFRHRVHALQHRGGFVLARHSRQACSLFWRLKLASGIVFDHATSVEVPKQCTNRCRFARDRGAGEASSIEICEVAAQDASVDVFGVDAGTASTPRRKFPCVVCVGAARMVADTSQRRQKRVDMPRVGHDARHINPG